MADPATTVEKLPLLADPADLIGVAAGGTTAGGAAIREAAVRRASDKFRSAVRHKVSRVTDERFTLDGDGDRILRLPVLNPTITAVEIEGQDVTEQITASANGYIRRPGGFPRGFGNITVTASHGYEPIPGTIANVVLEEAARMMNVQPGIGMLVLDGATVQFRPETGTTQQWTDAVEQYRIGAGDRA